MIESLLSDDSRLLSTAGYIILYCTQCILYIYYSCISAVQPVPRGRGNAQCALCTTDD
jgi:hypothetical protein